MQCFSCVVCFTIKTNYRETNKCPPRTTETKVVIDLPAEYRITGVDTSRYCDYVEHGCDGVVWLQRECASRCMCPADPPHRRAPTNNRLLATCYRHRLGRLHAITNSSRHTHPFIYLFLLLCFFGVDSRKYHHFHHITCIFILVYSFLFFISSQRLVFIFFLLRYIFERAVATLWKYKLITFFKSEICRYCINIPPPPHVKVNDRIQNDPPTPTDSLNRILVKLHFQEVRETWKHFYSRCADLTRKF